MKGSKSGVAKQLNCSDEQIADIQRASALCKVDLSTGVVQEFPSMQGTIGKYYALHFGEKAQIAQAIEEHYMPRDAHDNLAIGLYGNIIALADRLDTLSQLFAINIKPTGSKDPYALRRAAIGIKRILSLGMMQNTNLESLNIDQDVLAFIDTKEIKAYAK